MEVRSLNLNHFTSRTIDIIPPITTKLGFNRHTSEFPHGDRSSENHRPQACLQMSIEIQR